MNSFKTSLFLFILISTNVLWGQFYIRYNHVGYAPNSPKELVILSDTDLKNTSWTIKNNSTSSIFSGSIDTAFCSDGKHSPFKYNYKINFSNIKHIGNYTFSIKDSSINIKIDTNLYAFIPQEILRYFRVQRSGSKDALDHKISHKGDKRCLIHRRKTKQNDSWEYLDEIPKYANMTGGWYDAGDYIKFTLTTSYSAYLMLLAYEQNPSLFQYKLYSQSNLNDLLDEAAWGLDYLTQSYKDTNEFIIQVGGNKDHQQGNRLPEFDELNRYREAYSAFSPTQMAYTAAALALGSKIFKNVDSLKSKLYLKYAEAIYKKTRLLTDCYWVKQGWEEFYADKTPYDNLLLAATELYRSTENSNYKEDMYYFKDLAKQAYWASWSNCNLLAHSRSGISDYDQKDLEYFKAIANESSNIWGVPHQYTWGSLYSYYAVGNGSLYYQNRSSDSSYAANFYSTLNYSLGNNNWGTSFVCSDKITDCACNIYSQIYKLQPQLKPIGAIAEGTGDRVTHEQLKKYFDIPKNHPSEKFNSNSAVFYNLNTNFQTMETTIVGLAEGLLFYSLIDKLEDK